MKEYCKNQKYFVVLLLMASLLLSACGKSAKAATMHLVKTEGDVGVSDGEGKIVDLVEQMKQKD